MVWASALASDELHDVGTGRSREVGESTIEDALHLGDVVAVREVDSSDERAAVDDVDPADKRGGRDLVTLEPERVPLASLPIGMGDRQPVKPVAGRVLRRVLTRRGAVQRLGNAVDRDGLGVRKHRMSFVTCGGWKDFQLVPRCGWM